MRQGWEIKKLGDIGTFQRGGGFLKSDFVEDGYPCVHYGQIHTKFGVKTYNHLTCISEELALSKSKIANSGDIIIAITSEDVEGSCKCTAWLGDYDVAVGGHAAIFKHGLNPAFVAYYFRGPYFNTAKKVYAHGSKVVEIRPADIATINISYPSLSEQEKIVAELDCLSGIIEKKKQQLKELDNLAQSIFYEMFGDPVENDKGWETNSLKNSCVQLFAGGDVPKNNFSKVKTNEHTVPIISNGVGEKALYGYTSIAKVNEACITIAGRGTIGYCEVRDVPFFPVVRLIVAIPKTERLLPIVLRNIIDAHKFKGTGGAIPQLTIPMIKDCSIILPPLPLQQEFASKIEAIEKQKELIAKSIRETETLFNSRMDYYFN